MSKTIDRALESVVNTKIRFDEGKRVVEICNAFIFWTNFEGKPNKFGNSARTFDVAIPEEAAPIFTEHGWKVRSKESINSDTGVTKQLYYVNIKINMACAYPPIITLFTDYRGKKSRQSLNASTIGLLDRIDILTCDMFVKEFESNNFPGKVSGYLNKLNIVQEKQVEFDGKYDDWEEEDISEGDYPQEN